MRTRARAFSLMIKDLDTPQITTGPVSALNPQARRPPLTMQWPCTQQGAGERVRHPVEGPLVGDEAGHAHFVASFTHRTTDRLRTSRSIRSSAFSARSRLSSSM